MIQLSTLYTDPERHNTLRQGHTDKQRGVSIVTITDQYAVHRAAKTISYYRLFLTILQHGTKFIDLGVSNYYLLCLPCKRFNRNSEVISDIEEVIVRPLSTVGYTSVVASVIHSRQWSN